MAEKVVKKSSNVLGIYFDNVQAGWEQWFLLRSDAHHDSAECNRELEKRHLDEAMSRKAYIMDFGDLFDCMGGRYDPRRSYPNMRLEYLSRLKAGESYFNVIVKDALEFYRPYRERWLLQTVGNHEASVAKNSDVNLLDLFVAGMQEENGMINKGGYGGWVQFFFTISKTQKESRSLKYFHGSGGGGPVTKGTIQSNRQAVFLPDADYVVNGHIHESWVLALPRERISQLGIISQDMQYHVRTPTYKNDYGSGEGGWHIERGAPPKPMGAVWMRMYYERNHIQTQFIQDVE